MAFLTTVLDATLDRGHLQDLIEERVLAHDAMDASRVRRIREDMERADARRLQPPLRLRRAAGPRRGTLVMTPTTGQHDCTLLTARPLVDRYKDLPYLGSQSSSSCPRGVRMLTSKLTSKSQTTVPRPVRAALGLRPGDEIAYRIDDGQVILTKARAGSGDDPFKAFDEWDSEADRQAYADL